MKHHLRKTAYFYLYFVVTANAQTPIPGKYYEYYTIARTGSGFTALGAGPSINDAREVAFQGSTSNGNGLWFGTGNGAPVNFNPGESFSSSDIIQPGVQINANHQVVSEDRITTTSPATTSIRLYNANTTDIFNYITRGGDQTKPITPFSRIPLRTSMEMWCTPRITAAFRQKCSDI